MKLNLILIGTIVLAITVSISVDGKTLKLRPMSAREVYKVLREAGREDAVPEGRHITQGLAAIKGFALGITKGVGGALFFDLITSNATSEMLNSFNYSALVPDLNSINYTALVPDFHSINYTALLPTFNLTELFGKGNTTTAKVTFTQQEICFNSRSLNDIDDNGEEEGQLRQATPTSPTITSPSFPTSPTLTSAPTTTMTMTSSVPTTPTTNCIVIQKPVIP